ncbi:hypothetical protein JQ636_24750 [Bradyrhizobium japonicum]|uniref:hypothetical protein n=1 Tax=Bradyrhizobium japonicum TaxID=375 RepID=UPI001BA9A07D|nr:hypothetical protein [Bradyrhizobium japonicum]MBR0806765.1 hypothetical protein [Bradyrhizobium japonicum]
MTNLTDIDRAALERSLTVARSEGGPRSHQLDAMLRERPWVSVAAFASVCSQTRTLHLEPWEWRPAWITDIEAALRIPSDARHIRGSARLLQKMLARGLSRFEPPPCRRFEQVEQRQG